MMKTKITELVRTARLRQPLVPSVTFDAEISGFALIVTLDRDRFWALFYRLRGLNPATGKRWGGGIRHELGDAMLIPVAEARQPRWRPRSSSDKGGAHTMKPWPHAPPRLLARASYHQQSMKLSTLTLQRL